MAARLSRGWGVGSGEFKVEMRQEAAQRGVDLERERFAGLGPGEVQSEQVAGWEERLRVLAQEAEINLEALPLQKSHPAKALFAAALKQSTSVSTGWLSEHLGLGPPASASQFDRRWPAGKPPASSCQESRPDVLWPFSVCSPMWACLSTQSGLSLRSWAP